MVNVLEILHWIPTLTEKGKQELRSHKAGVNLEWRWILILIDGRSTVKEILDKATVIDKAPAILLNLINEGYMETKEVYNLNLRFIEIARDVLGKDASIVAKKLEDCSFDRNSILSTILQVKKTVQNIIGDEKANVLESRLKIAGKKVAWL